MRDLRQFQAADPHVVSENASLKSVSFEILQNGCGRIILNRKKALNSLTSEMFGAMHEVLVCWDASPAVRFIIIEGEGRAFCAGGDLKDFTSTDADRGGVKFAHDEYLLDCRIGNLRTPYLAILDGVVMGGGCGVSINGRYRVATDNTLFAMPECSIGYFTDVGASHFFNQCPGQIGKFLALTGTRLGPDDCLAYGIATHRVSGVDALQKLKNRLFTSKIDNDRAIRRVLESTCTHQQNPDSSSLAKHHDSINACFAANTIESIIENLRVEGSEWSRTIISILRKQCPMSLKAVLAMLRITQALPLAECLRYEYRVACRLYPRSDLREGVRAVLIDRDNEPCWNPSSIEAVPQHEANLCLAPLSSSNKRELEVDEVLALHQLRSNL